LVDPMRTFVNVTSFVWGAFMLFLTLYFLLAITALFWEKPRNEKVRKCLSCSSFFSTFIVGLLVLSFAIILGCVFQAVGRVGSDTCYPSPDQNIQKLLSESTGSKELNTIPANGPVCQPIIGATGNDDYFQYQILCYYQTCTNNTVLSTSLEFLSELTDDLKNALDPLQVETTSNACQNAVKDLLSIDRSMSRGVAFAVGQFSCSKLNPVYVSLINEGLCEGFFNGLWMLYSALVSGSSLLLAAMIAMRHFYLERSRNCDFEDLLHRKEPQVQSAESVPAEVATAIVMI